MDNGGYVHMTKQMASVFVSPSAAASIWKECVGLTVKTIFLARFHFSTSCFRSTDFNDLSILQATTTVRKVIGSKRRRVQFKVHLTGLLKLLLFNLLTPHPKKQHPQPENYGRTAKFLRSLCFQFKQWQKTQLTQVSSWACGRIHLQDIRQRWKLASTRPRWSKVKWWKWDRLASASGSEW